MNFLLRINHELVPGVIRSDPFEADVIFDGENYTIVQMYICVLMIFNCITV